MTKATKTLANGIEAPNYPKIEGPLRPNTDLRTIEPRMTQIFYDYS